MDYTYCQVELNPILFKCVDCLGWINLHVSKNYCQPQCSCSIHSIVWFTVATCNTLRSICAMLSEGKSESLAMNLNLEEFLDLLVCMLYETATLKFQGLAAVLSPVRFSIYEYHARETNRRTGPVLWNVIIKVIVVRPHTTDITKV